MRETELYRNWPVGTTFADTHAAGTPETEGEPNPDPNYEAEYDAGYAAFMWRCAHYATAHAHTYSNESGDADHDAWTRFWQAGIDRAAETDSYIEGWEAAQARILREAGMAFGAFGTPRQHTLTLRALAERAEQEGDTQTAELFRGQLGERAA